MIRLLFLTQTYPREPGDTTGPFIRDLARALARGGDAVRVLAPHAAGLASGWDDDGVEVRTFRYAPERWEIVGYGRTLARDETVRGVAGLVAPLYVAGAARALRRQLRDGRREGRPFDLVQAHWLIPNGVAALGMPRRVPLAIGLHGSDVFLSERRLLRPAVAAALRRAGGLTGCSPELVDRVCALGFDRAVARVIPYGVDLEQFRPDPGRRSLWRRRLAIPDAAPLVLTVGRMATKKGFDVLVSAFERLFERHPDVHVVLAGEGDQRPELEARSEPWRGRVHFPGAVYRDVLPDLYRAADVFTLPAVHDPRGNVDGLPNVILEAMATALPVVATAISGIPLAVRDGETGRLVAEKDPAALAEALSAVLADPARGELGRCGRELAERELSWEAVAGRYREAYLAAITTTGGRRDDSAQR